MGKWYVLWLEVRIFPVNNLRNPLVNEEGCLSVPQIFDKVERPARVKIEALDLDGKTFTLEADGLLAVCIQHEMDHLDGKLFADYLSPLKRQRIREKIAKAERIREKEKVKVRR